MNSSRFIDLALILLLIVIILTMLYSFFEPKFVLMYNKKEIVSNVRTIEELEECSSKYYNALIYEKVYLVNEMQTVFNKKSLEEIKKVKEKHGYNLSYDLVVKQAYRLSNNIYLCDIEIIPELDKDKYDWDNTKTVKVIIKLDKNNYTFKIFYDEFNLN